jgi:hypothetical protein
MRAYQRLDDGLLVVWQDQRIKSTFVPDHVGDARDGELEPEFFAKGKSKNNGAGNEKLLVRK